MVNILPDVSFLHRTGIAMRKKETLFPARPDNVPDAIRCSGGCRTILPVFCAHPLDTFRQGEDQTPVKYELKKSDHHCRERGRALQ